MEYSTTAIESNGRGTLATVNAFVMLTKPRIIELLLITTVPSMILAHGGMPRLSLVVLTIVGGALAAGGANTFNMYIDRDIDRLMERTPRSTTGNWRYHPPVGTPLWNSARSGRFRSLLPIRELAFSGSCSRRMPFLRVCLLALVKENLQAEHRYRWRCRGRSGTNWMGCCNWVPWPQPGLFCLQSFLLDPTAFLGFSDQIRRPI